MKPTNKTRLNLNTTTSAAATAATNATTTMPSRLSCDVLRECLRILMGEDHEVSNNVSINVNLLIKLREPLVLVHFWQIS